MLDRSSLPLIIRGLSCPSCIQASLSLNCLKLTIPGFPHNCLPVSCGDFGFKKISGSCIRLEIRPCSARDWDGKDYLRIIPRVVLVEDPRLT